MVCWALLAASCAAPVEPPALLVRGPYLQSLLADSVEIAWRTDLASRGAVRVRAAGGAESTFTGEPAGTEHRVKLTGLEPAVRHEYALLDGDRVLAEGFRFRTAPRPGEGELHAVVVGDSGDGLEHQHAIAKLLGGLEADLFLHTGDYDYTEGNLEVSVFVPYQELLSRACFFPARGNHDLRLPWRETFSFPGVASTNGDQLYYSLDWGPAHLAFLDSNSDAVPGGGQLRWLEADLASARSRAIPWLVLILHEPVYTVGPYSLSEFQSRILVEQVVDRFEVDLVLSGHDHNYQRSHPVRAGVVVDGWQDRELASPRGTVYLVTGGGGGLLYPELPKSDHRFTRTFRFAHHALELTVSRDAVGVRALSGSGEVLDAFVIDKRIPPRAYRFLRGDVDASGSLDIGDAVAILGHLFLGTVIECPVLATEAANVDGGARVELADAVYLLGYLFLGGPPPGPPYPECGPAGDPGGSWCTREPCGG